jgi:hypothetical protein
VAEEVEAEVDELEALNTVQLRIRGKALGVVPVGDKRRPDVWRQTLKVARAAVQRAAAAAVAATAAAATHASAASATATAVTAAEELRKRGRVRKLAPSDGWQTAPAAAVARRVVEDEQEDAVEDEEVVLEEDVSDEEADSTGPEKWVVPAWEVLANDRVGWRGGLKNLRVSECE